MYRFDYFDSFDEDHCVMHAATAMYRFECFDSFDEDCCVISMLVLPQLCIVLTVLTVLIVDF